MEKLGQLLGRGQVGSGRRRHPAVAQRAGLPRRAEAARAASWTAGCGGCCSAPGRGIGRLVTGAMGLAMKARVDDPRLARCSPTQPRFVQSLDSTFGGFREKADRTYELLQAPRHPVRGGRRPPSRTRCARRRSSSTGCRSEQMPLAGLILNRTHPDAVRRCRPTRADDAADQLASRRQCGLR